MAMIGVDVNINDIVTMTSCFSNKMPQKVSGIASTYRILGLLKRRFWCNKTVSFPGRYSSGGKRKTIFSGQTSMWSYLDRETVESSCTFL